MQTPEDKPRLEQQLQEAKNNRKTVSDKSGKAREAAGRQSGGARRRLGGRRAYDANGSERSSGYQA